MGRPFKDISEQHFGRLTAIDRAYSDERGAIYWLCVCDCGKDTVVSRTNLERGHVRSCGCLQKETSYNSEMQSEDLRGYSFGYLKVMERCGTLNGNAVWTCECTCGTLKEVRAVNLKNGTTISCGCVDKENKLKHGKTHTRVYKVWLNMRQRCLNPNNKNYDRYGGRGITICDRWQIFENFLKDMGNPLPKHSLDRIDNNGNYEPSNCRWTTADVQSYNKGY